MHEYLSVVVGFESVIENDVLFEDPINVLVLTANAGFALDPNDGWLPQMPALKQGGVWAESSTSVGRTLIAGEDSNVTETMRLVLGTGDPKTLYTYVVNLNRFIELARQHWTTFFQTLPVYLKWKATCGADYQYALIYNLDASVEYSGVDNRGLVDVTLSIEREPYWRANPPGTNPKYWYMKKTNQHLTASNRNLNLGSVPQWKNVTIYNKSEWSPTAIGLQTTLLTQNYIQINAEDVPGDAPALVEFVANNSTTLTMRKLYVAKSTKPTSGQAITTQGTIRYNSYDLAAGDAGINLGTKTNLGAAGSNEGLRSNGSSTNWFYWQYTVPAATTSFTPFLTWGEQYTGNLLNLDRTLLSGKFALFLRAACTGATGDVVLKVIFEEFEQQTVQAIASQVITDDLQVLVNNANTGFPLNYVGVVTIPFSGKRNVALGGSGKRIMNLAGNMRIRVEGKNTAGANRTLFITDLILLPIDDQAICLTMPYDTTGQPGGVAYDNTGYLDISNPNGIARNWNTDGGAAVSAEIAGGMITLEPARDQRLYFLMESLEVGSTDIGSPTDEPITIYMNIVPRWRGVRDA